jgi:hypothetical protein
MEQVNPNISAEDIQAAEQACRLELLEMQNHQKAVLEQVRAIVSPKAFKQINETLFDSGMTHTYLITDKPVGAPQDDEFILGELYINQTSDGGLCGDDYSGTICMPLGDGRFFQFSYAS